MSVRGKWRVVETPEYDMAGPGSYILFAEDGGEFALDCLTGSIHGRCEGDAVAFTWDGSDEMEPASGHGWAEMLDDGSLEGQICPRMRRRYSLYSAPIGHFFNGLLEPTFAQVTLIETLGWRKEKQLSSEDRHRPSVQLMCS